MNAQRYPEEFRIEAVKQILEHGHSVADVSRRLGVSTHSLYKWIKLQQIPAAQRLEQVSQSEELRRIKAELKRVTEERDILKKAALVSTGQCNMYLNMLRSDWYDTDLERIHPRATPAAMAHVEGRQQHYRDWHCAQQAARDHSWSSSTQGWHLPCTT